MGVQSRVRARRQPEGKAAATLFLYVLGGVLIQLGANGWKLALFCAPVVTGKNPPGRARRWRIFFLGLQMSLTTILLMCHNILIEYNA